MAVNIFDPGRRAGNWSDGQKLALAFACPLVQVADLTAS